MPTDSYLVLQSRWQASHISPGGPLFYLPQFRATIIIIIIIIIIVIIFIIVIIIIIIVL